MLQITHLIICVVHISSDDFLKLFECIILIIELLF